MLTIEQRQALKNLSAVLDAAGSSIKNVVKVNVFLDNMANFAAMNEVYDEFFSQEPKPVCCTSRGPNCSESGRADRVHTASAGLALPFTNCLLAPMSRLSARRMRRRRRLGCKRGRNEVAIGWERRWWLLVDQAGTPLVFKRFNVQSRLKLTIAGAEGVNYSNRYSQAATRRAEIPRLEKKQPGSV